MNKFARVIRSPRTALALVAAAPLASFAQATDPLTAALGGVSLTGVAAAVGVLVLAIIGISMAFKGADLGKRAVRKV
jgi:ADP-ribosylglycohydrolase